MEKLNKKRAELIRLRNEYQIAYSETMNSVYDNLALFLFYLGYFKVDCQQIYDNM